MTTREIFVDDLQQMEDSLIWLEKNSNNQHIVSTWGILRAVCRTLYHLLTDRIRTMDNERRKQNG
jgi:hypothetical protein